MRALSPGDGVAHPEGLEEIEQCLGLQLAVPGQQLHLDALTQNLVEESLHQLLLVHVQRSLHVAEGKSFDVHEEQRLVSEAEALLAASHPCVGVA